jgi:hypothetical protein
MCTQSDLAVATRLEHLSIGGFASTVLFELGERYKALPSFQSADEIRAAVATHSLSFNMVTL